MNLLLPRISILLITLFMSSQAFSFVQVSSITENNPPSNDCSATLMTVSGSLGGANYTYAGATFSVVGFNIIIDVEYTIGGITLPAIAAFSEVVDLGFLASGAYSVTTNGVFNGTLSSSLSSSLIVNQCCNANPSFTSSNVNICVGETIQLTNTSTGTTSQIWYENNGQVSTATDYSTMLMTAGAYVYKLVVTDGTCSDSSSFTVNVFDAPVITSAIASASQVCEGSSITFSGTATGAFSYNWLKDGQFEGSGNNFTTIATGVGVHLYSLVVASACTDTMHVSVEYLATPSIDSLSMPNSICIGEDVNLYSSTTGATTEMWYEDNVFTANGSIYTATPTMAGTYNYKLLVSNGTCSDSVEQDVEVFDLPMVYLGVDTTSCGGPGITLDAGPGMMYDWSDMTTGQTVIADSGTYFVTVTDVNGCSASDTIEIINCASLFELNNLNVTVYPNPVQNLLYLDLSDINGNIELSVMDINGKLVYKTSTANSNITELDCINFESGAYFVHIQSQNLSGVVKFTKL